MTKALWAVIIALVLGFIFIIPDYVRTKRDVERYYTLTTNLSANHLEYQKSVTTSIGLNQKIIDLLTAKIMMDARQSSYQEDRRTVYK